MLYAAARAGHLNVQPLLRIKMFAEFHEETERDARTASQDAKKKKPKKAQRGTRTS